MKRSKSPKTDKPVDKGNTSQQNGEKAKKRIGMFRIADLKGALSFNPAKSVGTRLFLVIFTSILACVLIVGLLSYSISKSTIESQAKQSGYQTIQQTAEKLDLMIKNYEELTMQVIVDSVIQERIAQYSKTGISQYERFEASRSLNERLQSFTMSNRGVQGSYLIPIKQSGDQGILGSSSLSWESVTSTDWYKAALEQNGRTVWIPTQPKSLGGSGSATFGVARLLKNTLNNDAQYVFVLEISLKEFQNQFENVHLGNGSRIVLLDQNNNYLTNADETLIGQPSDVQLPVGENAKASGTLEATSAGGKVLAIYQTLESPGWRLLGTIPVAELVKSAGYIRNVTVIVSILAAVLAAGIGIFVLYTVAVPLSNIRNLMNEGERGNLSVRSKLKRKDEIGQLSQSFNQMMEKITELVQQTNVTAQDVLHTAGELSEASKKTALAAKEIAVATEEIAGGATSLAMEAERGTDLTLNINTQMKRVLDAKTQMSAAAGEVEQASERGTTHMSMLIEKTGAAEEMTRNMVEKVDRLKESTRSIRKILDVLNNITKQTNILSLNATIEAARAGAAGKGFMVVADEIRKLADQSRQSIDVVAQMTETIQHEIDETVTALSDAYPIFQQQIESVKETSQIFHTVQGQMNLFVHSLHSVTESIGELDQSQSVLSEAMSNVSAVAQQSSATSEEVASLGNEQLHVSEELVKLSDKLENASRQLKESLSKFSI